MNRAAGPSAAGALALAAIFAGLLQGGAACGGHLGEGDPDAGAPPPDSGPVPTCVAAEALCGASCVNLAENAEHCGVCGHSCLGGPCQGGRCEAATLVSGITEPGPVAVGPGRVYFVDRARTALGFAGQVGTPCLESLIPCLAPFTGLDGGGAPPTTVAVSGGSVLVAMGHQVLRTIPALSSWELVAESAKRVTAVAGADGASVWSVEDDACFLRGQDDGAGTSRCLAQTTVTGRSNRPVALAVARSEHLVFVADRGNDAWPSAIRKATVGTTCYDDGCDIVWVGDVGVAVRAVAVEGAWLYWVTSEGVVYRRGIDGRCANATDCPMVVARRVGDDVRALAVDDRHAYWATARGVERGAVSATCCGDGSCATACEHVFDGIVPVDMAGDPLALFVSGVREGRGVLVKLVKP